MRASSLKQICSLGVVLPFDLKISCPPKLVPLVLFNNKAGSELKTLIQNHSYSNPDTDIQVDHVSELVFVKRNYDGSELYYFLNTFTPLELSNFGKFIKDQKGGMLL